MDDWDEEEGIDNFTVDEFSLDEGLVSYLYYGLTADETVCSGEFARAGVSDDRVRRDGTIGMLSRLLLKKLVFLTKFRTEDVNNLGPLNWDGSPGEVMEAMIREWCAYDDPGDMNSWFIFDVELTDEGKRAAEALQVKIEELEAKRGLA